MTDTPTIALYYREHDPLKRKMFLEQSIAAGEDEEANAIRKELWELRYQGRTESGSDTPADGYLALWMAMEFNKGASGRFFGAKGARKEIVKNLEKLKFKEFQEKSDLHRELLYRECCHMVKTYMELCEKDKTYNTTLCGIVPISEKTAKLLNLQVGDTITLERENEEFRAKVAVITENYMGHYIYMTPKVYEQTFGEKPDYQDVVFSVKDEYLEQAEEIGKEIIEQPGALSISYTSSLAAQVERMLSTLGIVIVVLIVSAGMLAFVVLYNLNNINITERQRELATLKVLGFYDKEVSQYVLRENILLTIAGIIFGSGFGVLLHRYIIVTVEVDAVMFGRDIRPVSFLYCAVITCIFSVVVNWFMHRKLTKIDMVESLKSVE